MLILFKYFSAQTLVGAEVEWNDEKADSPGIPATWKGWINQPVILVYKIPDFSFGTTKKFFNREK